MAWQVHDGAKIRAARKARGLSQARLADIVGYSEVHIQNIERNERKPSQRLIMDIADALGVHPSYFADSDESQQLDDPNFDPYPNRADMCKTDHFKNAPDSAKSALMALRFEGGDRPFAWWVAELDRLIAEADRPPEPLRGKVLQLRNKSR